MLAMEHHQENGMDTDEAGQNVHHESTTTETIEALKAQNQAMAQELRTHEEQPVTATEEHQETIQNGVSEFAEVEQEFEHMPVVEVNNITQTDGNKILTPLIKEQLKYCAFILRGLKRHSQAGPFLHPVDPVALGIPDYPTIIKNPMDLSTIQSKIDMHVYESPEQLKDDVKLMFTNCYTYNKPETQVYVMGKKLEQYFDGHYAKLPTELSAVTNDDFGGKRRKSDVPVSRPRRESSTPRSQSIIPAPPSSRGKRSSPEMAFCMNTWKELTKKSNFNIAWPFLEPVDSVKLGIPDYPIIVKNPMDLSTVKKKLDAHAYETPEEFEADIRLIFKNCYLYNGAESDVSRLGKELEAVFDHKWATKPAPGAFGTPRGYDEYDSDNDKIIQLNKQIQALQKELDELLTKRAKRGPVTKPTAAPKPKAPKPSLPDSMSFDEKRQLSMDVNNLTPEKLGRVVEIIHNSMPNLQQQSDSDVIELDIESLDIKTLRELQKYVNECKSVAKKRKTSSAKKSSTPTGEVPAMPAPILEEAASSDDSSSSDDDLS